MAQHPDLPARTPSRARRRRGTLAAVASALALIATLALTPPAFAATHAVGDTTVSRVFEVRVDTLLGVAFVYPDAHSRPLETRVDTPFGVAFAYTDAHSRPFEARVDTLLGVPFAQREANSRLVPVRHADAYAPFAYHEAYTRAFHAFGQLEPAAVDETVPLVFAFHPPTPNPTRNGALLRFDLPVGRKVTVDVIDVLGRRVQVLADHAAYAPGRHSLRLSKGRLPSGLYFVRLNAGDFGRTRRLVVLE